MSQPDFTAFLKHCQTPLSADAVLPRHNWGYGDALPVREGSMIVDLARYEPKSSTDSPQPSPH
jgi:hypothetical protein